MVAHRLGQRPRVQRTVEQGGRRPWPQGREIDAAQPRLRLRQRLRRPRLERGAELGLHGICGGRGLGLGKRSLALVVGPLFFF